MHIKQIFDYLDKKYESSKLFSIGLHNKFDNSRRIYLDEFSIVNRRELFLYLMDYVQPIIKDILKDDFYVCICDASPSICPEFSQQRIQELNQVEIEIPSKFYFSSKFIEDEEHFLNHLFYKGLKENITDYIWLSLATSLRVEPHFVGDIFFVSGDLKTVINIYDDRGMDIVTLASEMNTS